jgi:hypothetical protein
MLNSGKKNFLTLVLSEKKFLNETKNHNPPPLQVKWSVPNDMPEMVESSTYLFADDTTIFREIREENDEKMLQADLDSLQSWSDTWLLKFHPNKCKVMSVANKSVDKGTMFGGSSLYVFYFFNIPHFKWRPDCFRVFNMRSNQSLE